FGKSFGQPDPTGSDRPEPLSSQPSTTGGTSSVIECEELAQFYIDSGILPSKKIADALHFPIATIHQMTVLVSWNHRHMANIRKAEQYQAANLIRGYRKTPLILTPFEVMHE